MKTLLLKRKLEIETSEKQIHEQVKELEDQVSEEQPAYSEPTEQEDTEENDDEEPTSQTRENQESQEKEEPEKLDENVNSACDDKTDCQQITEEKSLPEASEKVYLKICEYGQEEDVEHACAEQSICHQDEDEQSDKKLADEEESVHQNVQDTQSAESHSEERHEIASGTNQARPNSEDNSGEEKSQGEEEQVLENQCCDKEAECLFGSDEHQSGNGGEHQNEDNCILKEESAESERDVHIGKESEVDDVKEEDSKTQSLPSDTQDDHVESNGTENQTKESVKPESQAASEELNDHQGQECVKVTNEKPKSDKNPESAGTEAESDEAHSTDQATDDDSFVAEAAGSSGQKSEENPDSKESEDNAAEDEKINAQPNENRTPAAPLDLDPLINVGEVVNCERTAEDAQPGDQPLTYASEQRMR